MDDNAVLDALAETAGISNSFYDIWGKQYDTTAETRQAILAALGYDVGTEADRRASLDAATRRRWLKVLEPVAVIPAEAQPGHLDVVLTDGPGPDGVGHGDLTWTVRLEDGRVMNGSAALSDADILDRLDDVPGRGSVTRYRVALPDALPEGYHSASVSTGREAGETSLIVAPRRCWTPEDATGDSRLWGVSCQLYSLRKPGDQGLGTFSHLADFVTAIGNAGADTVGLNPLHSLYPVEPTQASPYSPSSRDFLNPLYIDVAAIDEAAQAGVDRAVLSPDQDEGDLIDYPVVAGRVFPALERVFVAFSNRNPETDGAELTPRAKAFRAFRQQGGRALHSFALFMALQEAKAGEHLETMPWWAWGDGFDHPDASGSLAFAEAHADRVLFHQWCQFIADEQLGAAAEAGRNAGLRMGLYRDLAIGVGPASAAAWSSPKSLVRGVSVGAPPDLLNRVGQNWGLAPLHPLYLRDSAYRPLIDGLRANMRHAGAIRIDHVMGLMHQYWVPEGRPATEGAYVRYPFDETLRILALESRRQQAVVIGEDLGTVPDGFRAKMAEAGVLSYRVMPFERVGDGLFARGSTYPALSVCTYGTHDLPTVDGWWIGRDIQWRRDLHLYGSDQDREADVGSRATDRRRLIDALVDAGVWPADRPVDTQSPEPMSLDLRIAIHAFLARSSSQVMVVQIEDALGMLDQMNLPGTTDGHPNWRRRLDCPVADITGNASVSGVFAAIAAVRGRHGGT